MSRHLRNRLTFSRDLVKGSSVTLKHSLISCELLPTTHDDIDVSWIDIEAVAKAIRLLCGDQRCAGSEEGIVDDVTGSGIIEDRPAHQLDRFLRAVAGGFFALTADRIHVGNLPDCGLASIAAPMCRFADTHCVPTGFVLPMIISAT